MSGSGALRVVAIADADSFVKWSAALLGGVAGDGASIRPHLLVVRTALTASMEQQRVALSRTGLAAENVTRVAFTETAGWLEGQRPDVVLLAGRGPFVRLMGRVIDRLSQRPVVVTGLPGMAIPAQRGALDYRRHADLMIVHSHREQRAFAELGRVIGVQVPTALATLPFARPRSRLSRLDPPRVLAEQPVRAGLAGRGTTLVAEQPARPIGDPARPEQPRAVRAPATDLVFAAQALVPTGRSERAEIAATLVRAAEADPGRRVVLKLRSRPGESETHLERDPYLDLLPQRGPQNLVVSYDSMASALSTAAGLVTVSSTAAIEAVSLGVPVIALDSFGVSKSLLNTVFVGSGLLGGRNEVVAGRFRHPHPDWLRDNYFHPPAESTWWQHVEQLVALRRAGALPARRVPAARGGALHEAWHRASVLGRGDRTLTGAAALAVGVPATALLAGMRRHRAPVGGGTWADAATDHTLEPNPFHDSIRR